MKKLVLSYFLFLFFFFSFFSSGTIDSQDGFQYLAVARNIYYTGKPTAPAYDTKNNIHLSVYKGKDGNWYSPTGIGYSLALLPAVAATDVAYKIFHIAPPQHFPLVSDWPILFFASFTNCFFGALLGVILFLFFLEFGHSKKISLIFSFISIISSNLFIYTKHSFAHMMFIVFFMLALYLIRLSTQSKKKRNNLLFFSGIAAGIMALTYNQTYILSLITVLVYLFLLYKRKFPVKMFLLGFIPFLIINIFFEKIRTPLTTQPIQIIQLIKYFKIGDFVESVYGILLSQGRSIFIYSPLLILPFVFWHKIHKKNLPEFFSFIFMLILSVLFYAVIFATRTIPNISWSGATWHGESSWGPRYFALLIPLGLLSLPSIFAELKKNGKTIVLILLISVGLYINILGLFLPYNLKFHDLQKSFTLNGRQIDAATYTNLLPNYNPIILMSKKMIKRIIEFPKTIFHGTYNVKLYDGIDFPSLDGSQYQWRAIEKNGYISIDSQKANISSISLLLINYPHVGSSNAPATVSIYMNNHAVLNNPEIINVKERKNIHFSILSSILKTTNNQLHINITFPDELIQKNKLQSVELIELYINDVEQNIESLDVPYISQFGPKLAHIRYQNWGKQDKNPWTAWNIHSQIYERTFDFWWLKPIYYWDYPKKFFFSLFIINIFGIIIGSSLVIHSLQKRL